MTTTISKQRELFNLAFDNLGGLDKLVQWANETNDKGNSNYGEFIKLFVKLVPAIKPDNKGAIDNHESFILAIMNEQKSIQEGLNKPIKLIDVNNTAINKDDSCD
jgi:hypothetical protein